MKRNLILSTIIGLALTALPALAFAGSASFASCSDFSVGSGTPHWTCSGTSLHATNVYSNGIVLHGVFTAGTVYTITGSYTGSDGELQVGICAADANSYPTNATSISGTGSFSVNVTASADCTSGLNGLFFMTDGVFDTTSGVLSGITATWTSPPPPPTGTSMDALLNNATSSFFALTAFNVSDVSSWMWSVLASPIIGGALALALALRYYLIALALLIVVVFFAYKAWQMWRGH